LFYGKVELPIINLQAVENFARWDICADTAFGSVRGQQVGAAGNAKLLPAATLSYGEKMLYFSRVLHSIRVVPTLVRTVS